MPFVRMLEWMFPHVTSFLLPGLERKVVNRTISGAFEHTTRTSFDPTIQELSKGSRD
jgi:hypothetical protein